MDKRELKEMRREMHEELVRNIYTALGSVRDGIENLNLTAERIEKLLKKKPG